MLIYQCVVLGILVALLLNTLSNPRLLRRPAVQPPPATGQLVSILIPARNDARAIARCVISLARQEHPHCEILVLDDQSDDDTAAIVERLAAALALVGWTRALLERSLGRAPMSQSALRLPATRDVPRTQAAGGAWRALIADAAVGVGSAVYLELSGLLPIWLLLAALVVLAMSPQLIPWRAVPAAASVLFGGLLLLAAGRDRCRPCRLDGADRAFRAPSDRPGGPSLAPAGALAVMAASAPIPSPGQERG